MRGKILAAGIALLAVVIATVGAGATTAPTPKHWDRTRVNYIRANHHLPAVKYVAAMQRRAQYWANHLAANRIVQDDAYGQHTCFRSGGSVYGSNAGVGGGTTVLQGVKRIEYAFEGSGPHRSNLLDGTYRVMGLGVVKSGALTWLVQDFCGGYGWSGATRINLPQPMVMK